MNAHDNKGKSLSIADNPDSPVSIDMTLFPSNMDEAHIIHLYLRILGNLIKPKRLSMFYKIEACIANLHPESSRGGKSDPAVVEFTCCECCTFREEKMSL